MMSRLKRLFDYQKYEGNERLAGMIAETEARYLSKSEICEEDLFYVNVAGTREHFHKSDLKDQKTQWNIDS